MVVVLAMKIDNAILLTRLFESDPEIGFALCNTCPYLKVVRDKCVLVIEHTPADERLLELNRKAIANQLKKILGYEIYFESTAKLEESLPIRRMIAIAEKQEAQEIYSQNFTEQKSAELLNINLLIRALSLPAKEVKIALAKMNAPIYPQQDGSETIEEKYFDALVLNWVKSYKLESVKPASEEKPTKPKLLTQELTINDIVRLKNSGPNLTKKALQQTLENFFGKVTLDDSSKADAVSAFIEGTSEFGRNLRKKLLTAYKNFFPGASLGDIENKLIAAAKVYSQGMMTATTTNEPEE